MALNQDKSDAASPQKKIVSKKYRSKLIWLILSIGLILAALSYMYGWPVKGAGGKADAQKASSRSASPWRSDPSRPIPVQAATAQKTPFDFYLEALGTVTAAQTVVVHSRIEGQLLKLHFKEGDAVKAGTLLAEIDPRPYQVQLTQAEGQKARDMAQFKNAQADLERYRTLLKQDSVSQQQVDTQAALVAQYEGLLKYDQGQIDASKLNLDYTRITAPITGRLGLRQVDVGNMVRSSDANGLVVITQEQPIDVMFALAENELPKVVSKFYGGAQFMVEAWDRSQQKVLERGKLTTIDNQIDVATGTVKLKARFENKERLLFPNQFVNVRMKIGTLQDALLVPSGAVQRGSVGAFVYVINADKTVSVRQVTVGDEGGGQRVIDKGLEAGDQVVIDGTDRLREGSPIELITLDGVSQIDSPKKEKEGKAGDDGQSHTGTVEAGTRQAKASKAQRP